MNGECAGNVIEEHYIGATGVFLWRSIAREAFAEDNPDFMYSHGNVRTCGWKSEAE